MTADGQCPHCGRELTAESLEGLCPYCVAYGVLNGEPVVGGQGSELRDQKSGATDRSPLARSFGDYELLEEIARGGMGVIYKARQKSLNRLVAVKMLLGGGHGGPKFRQRFSTEAEAAAQLHHPNIVAVHEVGEHEGTPFFSMDYVDGPDLERMTGHQPIAVERAARYVRTIAKAIHYAHQHGILHRWKRRLNSAAGSWV
jgi:serine/threonine protein kinase